jgi:hypothetical protein
MISPNAVRSGTPRAPCARRLQARNQRLNDLRQLVTSHQPPSRHRHPPVALCRPDTHPATQLLHDFSDDP